MEPGKLIHRITIQRVTETENDFGEVVETWANVSTVWASVEPIRGREFFDAAHLVAEATHLVTIRYLSGLLVKDRILFGSRVFNIVSFDDRSEQHVVNEILCTEVVQ